MIFQLHRPAFPLNRFVEHLVYFDGAIATHSLDRFLPDGNTELIVDLTENPQYIYDNETLREIQTCRRAWVSGVRTQPITIPSGRESRMLIVAFKKGKAFPCYSLPMSELVDTVVEADGVFGLDFHVLREQLLASTSIEYMFQLVEEFLIHRAGDGIHDSTPTRCLEYALSSINRDPGSGCLQRLSEQIGYSQKHFIDLFRQQVGVSPKQYIRIMRFQKVIGIIENSPRVRWSQIAADSGYYDQAHLIHDFKFFSGFTPNEYVRRKSSLLNYVPVG
ncbi:MAG TPA: AraC family transcriptional regulator [Anaerolineales bacterium]|nr:AraC family transcriptional regulator [Anaerolineales bacterium]